MQSLGQQEEAAVRGGIGAQISLGLIHQGLCKGNGQGRKYSPVHCRLTGSVFGMKKARNSATLVNRPG